MTRVGVARFILADMYRMAPAAVLAVAPLGLVAAVARLLAAGLLLQFIASFAGARDAPRIDVLWFDLGVELSAARAWLWVAVIAATAVGAALIGYAQMIVQLRIGRRYSLHAAQRTLAKMLADPYKGTTSFDPSSFVFGAAGLLGMITPALTAIAFGTAMFVMRPGLSLVVAGFAAIFLGPVMIATGRRIMNAALRRRSTRNVMREHADPALSLIAAGPLYDETMRRDAVDDYVMDDAYLERFDSVFAIRANKQRARLMSGLLVASTGVALAIGLTIAEQPNSIDTGALILYVVVAQFATAAVGQIGVGLATFSRYLHSYFSYMEYVTTDNEPDEATLEPEHVGEIWIVRDKQPPSRAVLKPWLDALGVDPTTRCTLTLEPENFPRLSIGHMLIGGSIDSPDDEYRSAEFVAAASGRSLTLDDVDRLVTDLDPDDPLACAVALAPVAIATRPMVVVHSLRSFGRLPREQQKLALDQLDHHHLVLVGHGRDYLTDFADRVVDSVDVDLPPEYLDLEDDDL